MSLHGSGGSAAIFPMICCAKLGGIFEHSKNTLKSVIFEKIVRKNAENSDDIWVDLGRGCSD